MIPVSLDWIEDCRLYQEKRNASGPSPLKSHGISRSKPGSTFALAPFPFPIPPPPRLELVTPTVARVAQQPPTVHSSAQGSTHPSSIPPPRHLQLIKTETETDSTLLPLSTLLHQLNGEEQRAPRSSSHPCPTRDLPHSTRPSLSHAQTGPRSPHAQERVSPRPCRVHFDREAAEELGIGTPYSSCCG